MIIAFSWTSLALLAGRKSITRREWSQQTIRTATKCWERGDLIAAFSKSTRCGGQMIASIRLTGVEFEPKPNLKAEDWEDEGFSLLQALRVQFTKPKHDPDNDAWMAAGLWRMWQISEYRPVTAVRFEVVKIEAYGHYMLDTARRTYGEGWEQRTSPIPGRRSLNGS